jgi:hypothetical protein
MVRRFAEDDRHRQYYGNVTETEGLMDGSGKPNTIDLRGFDSAGQPVYSLNLSTAEFPKAKHLWDDTEYISSHGIARLLGVLHNEQGAMEQQYERHYDPNGRYLGGTIEYADGRVLHANTDGLEPSTILHGKFVFTVHYLHNTSQPKAPTWYAFSLVVFDQNQRVYPVELFDFPKDQQPPAIEGTGATNIDAYRQVQNKLLGFVPGELPES